MYKPNPEKLKRILSENNSILKEKEAKLIEAEKLVQKLRDEVTDLSCYVEEDTRLLNSISHA